MRSPLELSSAHLQVPPTDNPQQRNFDLPGALSLPVLFVRLLLFVPILSYIPSVCSVPACSVYFNSVFFFERPVAFCVFVLPRACFEVIFLSS